MHNAFGATAWTDVTFPAFGGRKAQDIEDWKDDPSWVVRYTYYAEAMAIAARAHHLEADDADAATGVLESLGDPVLGVWKGLDTSRRPSPSAQGRFLLTEVFLSAIAERMEEERGDLISSHGAQAILAWHVYFAEPTPARRNALLREFLGDATPADPRRWGRDRRWPDGLHELDLARREPGSVPSLQRAASVGLRRLTVAIDRRLAPEQWQQIEFDPEHPFDGIVPDDLAGVLERRAAALSEYRDELRAKGLHVGGIDDHGLTDILREGLPRLREYVASHRSLLLVGPTTTGKNFFANIAAAHVISRNKKVIVLLPTKALVAQAAEEWREFIAEAPSCKEWRLVEASRDHPYNDEVIAKGDYHILLAIPEKLAAYISGGSRLMDQCGLLIVDELQFLAQRQRGANIESLLTMIRARDVDVPIIGLSATLNEGSSVHVLRWLGRDGKDATPILAKERPVALDRYACTSRHWMCRRADGSYDEGNWALRLPSPVLHERLQAFLPPPNVSPYRDVVALVTHLLGRPDARQEKKSVLVFVGSRRAAEQMTKAIQAALEFTDLGEASSRRSPHNGRFGRQVLTPEEVAERDAQFFRLPNLPATDDLGEGLRTGVMYHSARLDPEHRRIIESAYKERVVRVIVATATLAVGMNLPADFVVIADVAEGVGGFEDNLPLQRLLDPHDMAQRFGRAGRLLKSTEGEAYVMVPPSGDKKRRLRLSDEQVARLLGDVPGARSLSPVRVTVEADRALADIGTVFDYFVDSDDTGEVLTSNLDAGGFARLLLQDVCRGAPALSMDEVEARAGRIYEHSLLKAEGGNLPDVGKLVELLEREHLIGPAPEAVGKWKITGLGRTIALSNLAISNAPCVRRVAEAAQLGAGPLTLLSTAAEADYVRELTWVNLPQGGSERQVNQLRALCWRLVRAFAEPGAARPESFEEPSFLTLLEGADLVGKGRAAETFRDRVGLHVEQVTDEKLAALLRASIAHLWMIGYPMNSIMSCIVRNTRVTENRRSKSIQVFPADVRDLGERLSYILNAAAEVLRVAPEDGRHFVLKNMAEALHSGLPHRLAPLLRLRAPRIHRERLSALLDMRTDELDFDDLHAVLDRLSTPRADRTAQEKRAHQNLGFTNQEKEAIVVQLTQGTRRSGSRALPPDLRDAKIPTRRDTEGSLTYGKLADDLARKHTSEGRVDDLAFVLEEFGLDVEVLPDVTGFRLSRDGMAEVVEIVLVDRELDSAALDEPRIDNRVLVLFEGMTMGAEYRLRDDVTVGFTAMTPWVLLAALARIDRHWRVTCTAEDPDAELARRVLRFFSTLLGPVGLSDVSLAEVAASLPAPPPLFAE